MTVGENSTFHTTGASKIYAGQIPDSIVGPFSKGAVSGRDGGFLVGGTAWYRKHFVLDKNTVGKQTYITFDGVYMNADVWINGHHLGNHPNGYTSLFV